MNIGTKVVCIDDDWSKCWDDPRKYFSSLPEMGRVYVVSGFHPALNAEFGVSLVGISSANSVFYPWRFRLLKAEPAMQSTTTTTYETKT